MIASSRTPDWRLCLALAVLLGGFALYASWTDARIDLGGGRATEARFLHRVRSGKRAKALYEYRVDGVAYRIQGGRGEDVATVDYLPDAPRVARLRHDVWTHRMVTVLLGLFAAFIAAVGVRRRRQERIGTGSPARAG